VADSSVWDGQYTKVQQHDDGVAKVRSYIGSIDDVVLSWNFEAEPCARLQLCGSSAINNETQRTV
jgi:hypothetical protein